MRLPQRRLVVWVMLLPAFAWASARAHAQSELAARPSDSVGRLQPIPIEAAEPGSGGQQPLDIEQPAAPNATNADWPEPSWSLVTAPRSVRPAQLTIPEIESPTTLSSEPPPLFIPNNGPSMSAPNLTTPGLDDAYNLGSCYLRSRMPMAAIDAMADTPSATDDIRYSKQLAIGAAFGQLNLLSQARSEYCQVLNESNNPVLRGLARDYLQDVDKSLDTREYFRGSAGASVRYDSNPGILPTFNAVGIPFHAPASAATQYYANLGYDILRTDNSDLTLGYSLYGTNNYNSISNNYNINQNEAYLLYRRRGYWRDTPTYAGLYTGYQYMTVGGQSFLSRPLINPYVTFMHDDRRSTLFYGEYGAYNYLSPFNPGGSALDTNSRQGRLGVTFRRKMGESQNLMLAGGYQAQANSSRGTDYDFTGQSLIGYMLWNVPSSDAQLMLTSQYIYRDYSNVNSIVGYKRRDNELVVFGTLLKPLGKKWFLVTDVGIDDNDSNVSFNKYARVWANLSLEYRFPGSWAQRSRMIY